jgi:hypothetical protein
MSVTIIRMSALVGGPTKNSHKNREVSSSMDATQNFGNSRDANNRRDVSTLEDVCKNSEGSNSRHAGNTPTQQQKQRCQKKKGTKRETINSRDSSDKQS